MLQGLMNWWYRYTLPHIEEKTFAQREQLRHARILSIFSLVIGLITLLSFPATISFDIPIYALVNLENPFILVLIGVTLYLNHRNQVVFAGILCVLATILAILFPILTSELDISHIPLLTALVIPVILAGAVLRPVWSLFVSIINALVIPCMVYTLQTTSALQTVMSKNGITILITLISVQIVVAVVVFAIMQNLRSAMRRADQAEEIILLQQSLTEQANLLSLVNSQLEDGIHRIAQTHAQVANGNLDARVALNNDHVLWSIAVPLNNLLNRVKAWKLESDRHRAIQASLQLLFHDLQTHRKQPHFPLPVRATGTYIDPVLQEIYQFYAQHRK